MWRCFVDRNEQNDEKSQSDYRNPLKLLVESKKNCYISIDIFKIKSNKEMERWKRNLIILPLR